MVLQSLIHLSEPLEPLPTSDSQVLPLNFVLSQASPLSILLLPQFEFPLHPVASYPEQVLLHLSVPVEPLPMYVSHL